MTRVTIPLLDANLVDVTVTSWHVAPGAAVRRGDLLADLTTDKAVFELEASADGLLLEILAAVKSVVPVGYIAALIGSAGERDPGAAAANVAILAAYRSRTTADAPLDTPAPTAASTFAATPPAPLLADAGRIRATPKARRLAQAHGIDLVRVQRESGAEVVTEAVLAPYLPREAP